MDELRRAVYAVAEEHQPLTLRQLFYLLVAAGLIQKTEPDYRNVVIRLASDMREEGGRLPSALRAS